MQTEHVLEPHQNVPQTVSWGRVLALTVALFSLVPGLLFGGLCAVMTPFAVVAGKGNWPFLLGWLSQTVLTITSLVAWLHPSGRVARIPFLGWSLAAIFCSLVVIIDLQRDINEFQGECGNPVLSMMLFQLIAAGTVFGLLVIARCDYLRRRS